MATPASGSERFRFDIGLEDLQTFVAVAELGSFSRAAELLNLSQPSISNRVRRLEEKLLVRLLDRTTRKVELTAAGRRLYLQSAETLKSLRDLLREFTGEAAARERQVHVAATLMVATIGLPSVLRRFHEANPQVNATLHDTSPHGGIARVKDGRCDLAVMSLREPQAGVQFEPLFDDPCVVVTPRGHSLLRHEAVPLAEVLAEPLLSPEGHVDLRRAVEAEADRLGVEVRLAPEARGVSNTFTLLAMAAAGLGVCIHPRSFIPAELEPMLGIRPLADAQIIRTFGLVTPEARPLTPAARRFRDFMRASIGLGRNPWGPPVSFAADDL